MKIQRKHFLKEIPVKMSDFRIVKRTIFGYNKSGDKILIKL